MKKRLRRKLGKGEFAYPYPHTKKQRAANLSVAQTLAGLLGKVGAEKFLAFVDQHNEACGKVLSALYWKDGQVKELLTND